MIVFNINILILLISIVLYIGSFYLASQNTSLEKLSSYECGFEAYGNSRAEFEIIYYVVALLYIIFDLEIILLFPLGSLKLESIFPFMLVIIFFFIVSIGFIYEFDKGALKLK